MRTPGRSAAALVVCLVVAVPGLSFRAADHPPVMGRNAAVSAGHPLTTAAAFETLLKGGNAFDAGVAAMLVGGVVEQDLYSLGGEGLVLVYPRSSRKVVSVVGQGWAPKAATVDWYVSRGKTMAGVGLDPAVVPGALHAALTVLERWGTMKFEQVAARAIEYAERGFPLRPRTAQAIDANRKFIESWPDNRRMWLKPDGSAYKAGDTIVLPDLARTLNRMVDAERRAARRGRAAGIAAARDRFYKGDIAREMVAFLKQHDAPWELDDFSEFFAKVEEPAMTTYRGYEVYKHSFGSQGPALLEALNILEQLDLKSMGRNSADYVHTVVEALKLAYADRDSYFADQAFVESPAEGLLSKAYAQKRAAQIDPRRASRGYLAGDPLPFDSKVKTWPYWIANIADAVASAPVPGDDDPTAGNRQGHDAYFGHRPRRQCVRQHTERCLAPDVRRPRIHGRHDERSRRVVLARQDARGPVTSALAAALHADAEHRAEERRAVHGDRHTRGRQPGTDHPARPAERRRILAGVVPEPARGVPLAARADAALLRVVLAAPWRIQSAQPRIGFS